jgi:hypothetical protein
MKKVAYFVFFFLLGIYSQCFAFQNPSDPFSLSAENYYVQPGGVYVSPNGIFVLFNGELVQVNTLCSDEKGAFVPSIEMSRQFVWCPFCEHWYDPDKTHKCK